MAARSQHAGELAHRLLRILNMFQPFKASYVVKRSIAEGQFRVQIAAVNVDTIELKNLGIEIATADIESDIDQSCRQRALAGGHIQQSAARLSFENANHGIVYCLVGEWRWTHFWPRPEFFTQR